MDSGAVTGLGVAPPIPEAGLFETLRSWSGKGQLWEALAAAAPEPLASRHWSSGEVERRAHRVLFEQLTPFLATWPRSLTEWMHVLPVISHRRRELAPVPSSGVSWTETRMRGWPPREFVVHSRHRDADTVLLTALRFTVERLLRVATDARSLAGSLTHAVDTQLQVAARLMEIEPLASAQLAIPTRADVAALRSQGRPWGAVAQVADYLRLLDGTGISELATKAVRPDPEFAGALFHLGVLGELLLALCELGFTIVSRRPLSGGSPGPAYLVNTPAGEVWQLWFEAASIHSHSRRPSPYAEARAGLVNSGPPIGADLILVLPGFRALVIECKYSASAAYVASGYHQALSYATEIHPWLAKQILTTVVGPEGVVGTASFGKLHFGAVAIMPPQGIRLALAHLMGLRDGILPPFETVDNGVR